MRFQEAVQVITSIIDPAFRESLERDLAQSAPPASSPDWRWKNIVLVGHRASGKSGVLPILGKLLRRRTVDLDKLIEVQTGRWVSHWVKEDLPGFRLAERQVFQTIRPPALIAVGGGFLANHRDLLSNHVAVLVPISFSLYRERLLRDKRRPRLRPDLALEDEIEKVFREREEAHAQIPTLSLGELLRIARDGGAG